MNMFKTKLLFVCTQGMDRSPCACSLFKNSAKYEAKFCGTSPLSEIEISKEALRWADHIICMELRHKREILEKFREEIQAKPEILVLEISNSFCRNDQELERLLRIKLDKEGFL